MSSPGLSLKQFLLIFPHRCNGENKHPGVKFLQGYAGVKLFQLFGELDLISGYGRLMADGD